MNKESRQTGETRTGLETKSSVLAGKHAEVYFPWSHPRPMSEWLTARRLGIPFYLSHDDTGIWVVAQIRDTVLDTVSRNNTPAYGAKAN